MSFMGKRYKTIGVENEVNILLQGVLWGLIDNNIKKKLQMDYLQIFKLEAVTENGMAKQKITHSQEVPNRKFETVLSGARFEPITAKLYVISENDYTTMMLANEY